MPLKTAELQEHIKQAFKHAKETAVQEIDKFPPEEIKNRIAEIENKVQDQLAHDLASAFEVYVKSGDVVGVTTHGHVHIETSGNATSQQGDADVTSAQVGQGKIQ